MGANPVSRSDVQKINNEYIQLKVADSEMIECSVVSWKIAWRWAFIGKNNDKFVSLTRMDFDWADLTSGCWPRLSPLV